jgi:flagellar basal-body rod modification protein FlgD
MSTISTAANVGTAATNQANIASGQANLSESYSDFLTLLTTQLQNQDPTSPMDTNAFTQQLVSMTGVQQQLLTNELLQQMVSNSSDSVSNSVNLIGQQVTATTPNATLSGGQAVWTYSLPSTASAATATITNAAGATVWTGSLSGLSQGTNSFTWNGQNISGAKLADGGVYALQINARDHSGDAITPTIGISGVATSVEVVGGAANVTINGTQVPVSSVSGVTGS